MVKGAAEDTAWSKPQRSLVRAEQRLRRTEGCREMRRNLHGIC